MYFEYGETETEYLKSRDKKLKPVIERIGHICREVDTDLFSSIIHHIVGQQISSAARETVWHRLQEALGTVTAERVFNADRDELQSLGLTFRKTDYMKEIAEKVINGSFILEEVELMEDSEAIAALTTLPGIGKWTAEMILLFALQRPDILSYGDLAIIRGMKTVYGQEITKDFFETVRRRLSPYGSTAALYFWHTAAGKQ